MSKGSNPHSASCVTFDLPVLQVLHLNIWFSLHNLVVRWREIILVKIWARLAHNNHSTKAHRKHPCLQLPGWHDFYLLERSGGKNLLGSSTFTEPSQHLPLPPLLSLPSVSSLLLVCDRKNEGEETNAVVVVFTVVFRLLWEHLMEKLRFGNGTLSLYSLLSNRSRAP